MFIRMSKDLKEVRLKYYRVNKKEQFNMSYLNYSSLVMYLIFLIGLHDI